MYLEESEVRFGNSSLSSSAWSSHHWILTNFQTTTHRTSCCWNSWRRSNMPSSSISAELSPTIRTSARPWVQVNWPSSICSRLIHYSTTKSGIARDSASSLEFFSYTWDFFVSIRIILATRSKLVAYNFHSLIFADVGGSGLLPAATPHVPKRTSKTVSTGHGCSPAPSLSIIEITPW